MIIHLAREGNRPTCRCYDSLMSSAPLGQEAGYVLAGGASRRMGQDKALLEDGGVPLLTRVAEVVSAAAGYCAVVAPAGRYEGLGVPVLADLWPGEGPLGGILTALERQRAEWNLVVAVDMPFLEASFLRGLLREGKQAGRSLAPVHADGGLEPLCGVYHLGDLDRLRCFFSAGGRSVKGALREIGVATVPALEKMLVNVNTPEQWKAARG